MALEWNVYVSDFNRGKIVTHNVFAHGRLMVDLKKAARKYKNSERDKFEEQMRRDLMYYYWSKCEWEIIIDHWPHSGSRKDIKVDVWDQINLNWGIFCDYVWAHIAELRRKEKKDDNS